MVSPAKKITTMSDVHANEGTENRSTPVPTAASTPWSCAKCGYEGRVRTRLGKGMEGLEWCVFLILMCGAVTFVFIREQWAWVTAIVLLIIAGIYFFSMQFRPARTYMICPQCRKKSAMPREHYTPLIPPSRRSKRKRHSR